MATLPTVADLRARRLDVTRAALREQMLAGDLDDVRVVVESLAQEFDIADIAAAAVKLAHAAQGDEDEREIPPRSRRRSSATAAAHQGARLGTTGSRRRSADASLHRRRP